MRGPVCSTKVVAPDGNERRLTLALYPKAERWKLGASFLDRVPNEWPAHPLLAEIMAAINMKTDKHVTLEDQVVAWTRRHGWPTNVKQVVRALNALMQCVFFGADPIEVRHAMPTPCSLVSVYLCTRCACPW